MPSGYVNLEVVYLVKAETSYSVCLQIIPLGLPSRKTNTAWCGCMGTILYLTIQLEEDKATRQYLL
jgi:hypothetical protein